MSNKTEGILLVDKPRGKSSFYLVKILRALTKIKKIGHAGTLDPFATGIMVMLIGRNYTKLSDTFLNKSKTYIGTLHLGASSTTYDSDGELTSISDTVPTLNDIETALKKYQGKILQTPPMFSAKKINGKKLYELARAGKVIEREPVEIFVSTKLLEYNYPKLKLEIFCSKGTYIRSIAHDLGEDLQIGAYLKELIRTKSGEFSIEDCIKFSTLQDISFDYKQHLLDLSCKSSQTLNLSKI